MANSTQVKPTVRSFAYRCFKKDFSTPTVGASETVTKQFHLELGQSNELLIVEDRNVDWLELANKDVDSVGLSNILKLASKGLVDPSSLAFKDDEALDLGDLNGNDPESVKNLISSQSESLAKLNALAEQIGCSTDDLIKATLDGSLNAFISSKMAEKETTSEGGKE